MRRTASSRPRRWGIETMTGCDKGTSRAARLHIGRRGPRANRRKEKDCGSPRVERPRAVQPFRPPALLRSGIDLCTIAPNAQTWAARTPPTHNAITIKRTRSARMRCKKGLYLSVAAIAIAGVLAAAPAQLRAQTAVAIDNDDIGGRVTGANGPEAGVWVIAETTDLPTRYAKMVVTDDQGRYVLPDLPKAKYKVWVRGYGLVDSPKVDGEPGQQLNLRAVPAPNEAAAAQYYPAIYWYSMLKIPDKSEFGGKSNIPEKLTQVDWLKQTKNIGCIGCHQLGQQSTRTIPAAFGEFKSGEEAWMRRIQSGQSGEQMTNQLAGNFGGAPFKYYGDWTDRIAKGELPKAKPPRPQGAERNVVVTSWEWGTDKQYLHDLIS